MSITRRATILAVATVVNGAIIAAVAPDFTLAANILLAILAVKSWIFIALYGLRSNWTATATGRAIMRLVGSIALLCTQGSVTSLLSDDYPGRTFIRLALIALIALSLLDLLLNLIAAQREGNSE